MAEYLHVSRATIYRLIDRGLPVLRVGWVLRFDLREVLEWLRQQTASGERAHWTDEYPQIRRRDQAAEEAEQEAPPPPRRKQSTRRRIGPAELPPPEA